MLLVELARALDELRDESLPAAQRWARLRQMLREVAAMRREDHRAAKLDLEKQRWWLERERLERENRQGNQHAFLEGMSNVQQMAQLAEVFREEKRRRKKGVRKDGPVKAAQGMSGEGDDE